MADQFPKNLYVTIEPDGESDYPVAYKTIEEAAGEPSDGLFRIATYELKEIGAYRTAVERTTDQS